MRTLKFLLQKEFRQIFRDPAILRIVFMAPIMQLLLLPLAADYEIKNIDLAVVDHDHSTYSQQLISKITSSGYFRLTAHDASYKQALETIEKDKADIVMEIPLNFKKDMIKKSNTTLFLAINSINGVKANLGGAYLQSIIQDFNNEVRAQWIQLPRMNVEPTIDIRYSNWFNPLMNYQVFMVPGILVMLVTMVGSFLSALNIVKEKEIGTIEQINVTPIKKHYFILGKLIPFWILGLIILTIGLLIARLVYGIVPEGNLLTIYVFAMVYLLAVLGLGLLISTYTNTQQQAMLISFFIMMIFVLLGGLYTPIESMPQWAQMITKLNPVAYFIEVMRMVVLKGSTLADIKIHLLVIAFMAVLLNTWAILNYRKQS